MQKPLLASAFVVTFAAAGCGGSTHTHANPPPTPEEMGAGSGEAACDKTKMCAQVITCVDGQQYPTACGPSNCDAPLGPCEDAPAN